MSRNVVTLVNLTDKPFSFNFDGVGYIIPASTEDEAGTLSVTQDAALHARKKSIKSYDLGTGAAKYQVAIEGTHDITFMGKAKDNEEELIDRETDPYGKPETITVRGGKVVPSREEDALAPQE